MFVRNEAPAGRLLTESCVCVCVRNAIPGNEHVRIPLKKYIFQNKQQNILLLISSHLALNTEVLAIPLEILVISPENLVHSFGDAWDFF